MFKTLKKRSEKVKEKVDFKFRFHATRVPLSGWDKLVVSLVPIETGKAVIKTPKANVRNGNCQWLDSVIESTRLVQDVKTKEYEDRLYKLVVSMGSSRSGMLGETTVNLAEYAISNDPAQIALPLKNCTTGTVLHVNIQCITLKASLRPPAYVQSGSRDLAERGIYLGDKADEEFASDEDLDDSDLSENYTSTSMPSPSGQVPAGSNPVKADNGTVSPNRLYTKDGSGLSHLRYSSDSLEVPSTPSSINGSGRSFNNSDIPSPTGSVNSLPGRHTRTASRDGISRGGNFQDLNSSASSVARAVQVSAVPSVQLQKNVWQDLHGRLGDRPLHGKGTDDASRTQPIAHQEGHSALQIDLEAAEITIEELRSESITWQRQAQKWSLEVESLKQKLAAQVKHGAQVDVEKSALTAERDRLQLELDQLQCEKVASQERESGEDYASRQAEDAKHVIKEMEEEIAYQKEMNINLKLQLQKTQDSSMELVLAIKDMEETLDEQKKELDSLKVTNNELNSFVREQQRHSELEFEGISKHEDQHLDGLEVQRAIVDSSLPVNSRKADVQGGYQSVQSLEQKVGHRQQKLENLEFDARDVATENMHLHTNLSEAEAELNAKCTLVADLQAEVTELSGSSVQELSPPNIGAIVEDPDEVSQLKSISKHVVIHHQATEDASRGQLGSNQRLLDDVHSLAADLRAANAHLESRLKEATQKICALETNLEVAAKEVASFEKERELLLSHQELVRMHEGTLVRRDEEHLLVDKELVSARRQLQELLTSNSVAEQRLQELDKERSLLIEKLQRAEKTGHEFGSKVQARELEIAELLQEIAVYGATSREMAVKVTDLERSKVHLERTLRASVDESMHSQKLLEEVTSNFEQSLLKVASLEAEKAELTCMFQDAQEAGRLSSSRIEEMEVHLSVLTEEVDSARSLNKDIEYKMLALASEKDEFEQHLHKSSADIRVASEKAEHLVHEVNSLRKELDSALAVNKNSERRLLELEGAKEDMELQIADLDRENFHHLERISGLEAQLRYITEEKETYKLGKEDLAARLMDLQSDKAKVDLCLDETIKQHHLRLVELTANAAGSAHELHAQKIAHQNLEAFVEELKVQNNALEQSVRVSETRASDALKHAFVLEAALNKLNVDNCAAKAEINLLEAALVRLKCETDEKQELLCQLVNVCRKDLEERAWKAEEGLRRISLEKVGVVDQMQQEVKRLTEQMSSTSDEKEKLASQALIEASKLRAQNSDMEEVLQEIKENYKHCIAEASASREVLEAKLGELKLQSDASKARELEATNRLAVTAKELEIMREANKCLQDRLEKLDKELQTLARECERLASERDELLVIAQEVEVLKKERTSLEGLLQNSISDRNLLQESLRIAHFDLLAAEGEKSSLSKRLSEALAEVDDSIRAKRAVDEKLLRLKSELDAQEAARSLEAEQRTETLRLKRQNADFRRKVSEFEEEKEEFCKKVKILEDDLQCKVSALLAAERRLKEKDDEISRAASGGRLSRSLSRSNSRVGPLSPARESMELGDLRDKVKFLEVELRSKTSTLESLKQDFQGKERLLCNRIELLEAASEQLAQGGSDLGSNQVQAETQNSSLARREQGLQSQLSSQEVLRGEIQRLLELCQQHECKLIKFKEASKNGDILERVIVLETELAEALEANNMYKSQLRSAFAEQQNVHSAALQNFGDVDQVIRDLLTFKRQTAVLGEELKDMKERYSRMSLQFAEVEAQREELVMTVRVLKSVRKL